jgi:hypothetical protein
MNNKQTRQVPGERIDPVAAPVIRSKKQDL